MLRVIVVAAGAAVVIAGEKSLAGTHLAMSNRVYTGLVLAAPFLIVLAVLQYRANKASTPAAPASRPSGYPFRGGL